MHSLRSPYGSNIRSVLLLTREALVTSRTMQAIRRTVGQHSDEETTLLHPYQTILSWSNSDDSECLTLDSLRTFDDSAIY